MKRLCKATWVILLIEILILIYAATQFKVDDVTLWKGDKYDFNTGWKLIRDDGTTKDITLPYYEDYPKDTLIAIENNIPKEYKGMTMRMLTADKIMRVLIDGEVIYQFGVDDNRGFGTTPGSVNNFIDIPEDLEVGKIRMEFMSPYENYGGCIDSITVAERDVAVLGLLNQNLYKFGCAIVILLSGIVFGLLYIMQKLYGHNTEGIKYIVVYCFASFVYYCIETKAMNLFYGNQTLYSIMVFLILMLLPMMYIPYFTKRVASKQSKALNVLMAVAVINPIVQLPLQLFNIVDFMDMAIVSHTVLLLSILVTLKMVYEENIRKEENSYWLDVVAISALGLCGILDIVRSHISTSEHLEKYSLYGNAIFVFVILISQVVKMFRSKVKLVRENARLIDEKMELMKRRNEELKESEEKANAANTAKTNFLKRMSHEVRTPINAIIGMNEMIIRETGEGNIKEYAEDVASAAQVLLGLVNEILDLSKIEAGKMTLTPVEYDLASLVVGVYKMNHVRANTKNLDFIIKMDENVPSSLFGDDVKIRQILNNLLSNAVKYTHRGQVCLEISCEKDSDVARITFKVKDTGIGIKKEELPKIFDEFQRIEETKNRTIEGTGLGMSITVQLLNLMDSTLDIESEYGVGSTFYFTIEQKIVGDGVVGKVADRCYEKKESDIRNFTAPGKKILVIDDNRINLKIFTSILKKTQMIVKEADSGQKALDYTADEKYDIIFLDHMMPDMDGIETIKRIKEQEDSLNKNTPVVALTANAITGAKEYYVQEGFCDYLSKPIDVAALYNLIENLLNKKSD